MECSWLVSCIPRRKGADAVDTDAVDTDAVDTDAFDTADVDFDTAEVDDVGVVVMAKEGSPANDPKDGPKNDMLSFFNAREKVVQKKMCDRKH